MEQSRAFRFVGPQGNQLSAEAGHKARHMIVGEGLPAADLAMCVDNDEDFVAVARTLPAWPRIESALENLRKTEELHQSMDEAEIRAHQERVIAHVRRGIADLATTMDLHEQHDAVLTRAALGRPPLEPPIFDPLLMYDKPFATSPPVAGPRRHQQSSSANGNVAGVGVVRVGQQGPRRADLRRGSIEHQPMVLVRPIGLGDGTERAHSSGAVGVRPLHLCGTGFLT